MIKKILRKKKNNCNDKQIVDSLIPRLSFEQKLELLIWGDKALGIKGIKGRIERMERKILYVLILSTITSLALLEHLTNPHLSSGVISKMFIKIISLLLGG